MDYLRYHFAGSPYHVVAVSESWLHTEVSDSSVALPGVSILRNDRAGRVGGGVALYLRDPLRGRILAASPPPYSALPEYLVAKVKAPGLSPLLVSSHALHLVPFMATHHTSTADSLLDLCLVSDPDAVADFGQSETPFIAGHDLIYVTLAMPAPSNQRLITSRSYRNFSTEEFARSLDSMNWDCFFPPASADELLQRLQGNLTTALDLLAPTRTFLSKRRAPPWITPDLRALEREMDALYRRRISAARTAFYADRLSNASGSRALWNELRSLGLASSQISDCAGFSLEELNIHFAAVSCRPGASREVEEFFHGLPPPSYDDTLFYFADVSPAALHSAIFHFSSQSRGVDDLSLRNIKDALPAIFPFLLLLVNQSLNSGVFPASWKKARIIPLAKVKSPTSLQQMRPIANLCLLSKVLERVVLLQMLTYLESRSLLVFRQCDFRPGLSTQTVLLKLADDVRRGVNDRLVTIVVLFDFSKTFDSIPHALLLAKLRALGLSQHALTWTFSYLRGHSQAVVGPSGELSSWASLDQGVPQGSVLGPLHFVAFINDIARALRHTEHLLYADDLQVYLQCPAAEVPEAIARLNLDVAAVQEWSRANSLFLNASKTQAIILGSSSFVTRLNATPLPPVVVNGVPVPFSRTVRNLGFIFDGSLSWTPHVDAVSGRVHFALRQPSASRKLFTFSLRNYLVTALVFPLLDYCSVVFNDISGVLNTRLQRLLNSCIRFVCGAARDEHITPHRRALGWLSVRDRRLYFVVACSSASYTPTRQTICMSSLSFTLPAHLNPAGS
ncbi:uncharacterized protein LOC124178234 [Neodiprion fabricii]|uniref:uncharacterized protein LOC124178234 n=1 Tax=Neodiprion fabricii TaxID=2872261 RepID=UPI001ED8DFC3|nr:uncharacterized protein LOC124178234 [Neodiprion fabricii]